MPTYAYYDILEDRNTHDMRIERKLCTDRRLIHKNLVM
jgi:hypothetical protein